MGAAVTGDRRVPLLEAHRYEELLRRRALGESMEQLCRAFGLKTGKQVRDMISHRKRRFLDVCKILGVEPPKPTPRPSSLTHGQVGRILCRYAGGELPKTIAPDFNISGRRVRDLISQHLERVTQIRAQLARKPRSGQNATWGAEELGFLITHYPTDVALNAIARETRHHLYEVKRKAAELGLPRSRTAPSLEAESGLAPAANPGGPAFISANLEDVVGWLRANGCRVEDGLRSGTYRIGFMNSMTPQQVVRFANDRRARCKRGALAPFTVDAGTGVPLPAGADGRSLTGSSMEAA